MEKIVTGIALTFGFILLVVVVGLLLAWPVMFLVNYLFTPAVILAVFGTAQLSFIKAYGLLVLCGILFKSESSSK
jgi:hypothetical protein